jgi:hypothetical protein
MIEVVKDSPNWIRGSTGLVNTDKNEYMSMLKQRQAMARKDDEIDMLKTNINILTEQVSSMQSNIAKILSALEKSN